MPSINTNSTLQNIIIIDAVKVVIEKLGFEAADILKKLSYISQVQSLV